MTQTITETRITNNVIADSPFGDPRPHRRRQRPQRLGRSPGPGINDDGSGTSMDLELARNLGKAGKTPRNHVRFLWVGAEELGLLGSQFYVDSADRRREARRSSRCSTSTWSRRRTGRGRSTTATARRSGRTCPGPNGSGFIESLFTRWFDGQGQATEPIPFDGRSDYVAFTDAGIPAGGIFTGAEEIKTAEQQALFGGIAGQQLDPATTRPATRSTTSNLKAFGEMKDAAADVLFQLAQTRNPIVDGGTVKGHGDAGRGHGRANFQGETERR